jgi:hypothetical protein
MHNLTLTKLTYSAFNLPWNEQNVPSKEAIQDGKDPYLQRARRHIVAPSLNFSNFPFLTCSQIWLNPLVDDSPTHLTHKFNNEKIQLFF